MRIENISIEAYCELTDEFDCADTVMLGGWPCSVGYHPDLGEIAVLHFEDQVLLITRATV